MPGWDVSWRSKPGDHEPVGEIVDADECRAGVADPRFERERERGDAALLLIGANQLGIYPTLLADDLRTTLSARLPAEVYTMLLEMWSRTDRTDASTVSREQLEQTARCPHLMAPARAPATEPEHGVAPDAGDPFGAVGFHFDEGG